MSASMANTVNTMLPAVETVKVGTIQRRPSTSHTSSWPTPNPVTVSAVGCGVTGAPLLPGNIHGGVVVGSVGTSDVVAGSSAIGGRVRNGPAEIERSALTSAISASIRSTVRVRSVIVMRPPACRIDPSDPISSSTSGSPCVGSPSINERTVTPMPSVRSSVAISTDSRSISSASSTPSVAVRAVASSGTPTGPGQVLDGSQGLAANCSHRAALV